MNTLKMDVLGRPAELDAAFVIQARWADGTVEYITPEHLVGDAYKSLKITVEQRDELLAAIHDYKTEYYTKKVTQNPEGGIVEVYDQEAADIVRSLGFNPVMK